MDNRPIGIFDSGVGGISIWKELRAKLPSEDTIYLADSKNAPYGEKRPGQILDLSIKNTELLLKKGCKLIVVACNTATTNAIDHLRATYPIPFIGIEPAIKPAALGSSSGKVGVLATRGTLSSELFHSTAKNHASHIEILEQEGTGLVELIEQGKAQAEETRALIRKYIQPMVASGIDHLVLGCTHYPHLIPLLREELPERVRIIDCGEAVARQTFRILEKHSLLSGRKERSIHQFYTNKDPELLSLFLKGEDYQVSYLDF
ncbi:glutamate racemase [Muriicola jejuensis]|uniref:Glutamate racemase n=1 Tax=Muriicola jejuensis TaxID=504488 RepID=A0A6P0U8K3_9FLAO|nr:glutamate racemase [Muriicola jejuensis]NER09414.1 glutamate racemase [Muriicola jejuensis]SMP08800.1 glutamate racemase [Muriicola jejuensis]